MPPLVSIVYLTKNGGEVLKQSLEAVFSQTVDFEFEVIAVDSGSTDGTLELLASFPVRIEKIAPVQFNFGRTRDLGFSIAQGEILVTLSQDVVPVGDTWLRLLVEPFINSTVAVVEGAHLLPEDQELFYWEKIHFFYYNRINKRWLKSHNNIGLSFTCCAIRRAVWEQNKLGTVNMSEDKVFQKMIAAKGHRIITQPAAKYLHAHSYDVASLAKRSENEGLGWATIGQAYTFGDMLYDMLNPKVWILLLMGLSTVRIRTAAELLFPIIRYYSLYKGNNFTKQYVR